MADLVDTAGLVPRRAALRLLAGVLADRRMLSDLRDDPAGPLAGLSDDQRARARRLAALTLRHMGRVDRLLGPNLRRAPPLAVHNALRLALVEIFVDGAARHGAVHAAVALVRTETGGNGPLTDLANAVLRRCTETTSDDFAALAPPKLPSWLRRLLVADFGGAAVRSFEAAHAATPPLDLTPARDAPAETLAAALGARVLPTGSLRLDAPGRISGLPGYADGQWWVQDAGAALAARALGDVRDASVLDLCAAPGGKTLQLADAGARVTALDLSDRRLDRLRENLARTALSATIVTGDALTWEAPAGPGSFDAVLLDAPCTATGTIRRHPDLPHVKDGSELDTLVPMQASMIDRAVGHLRPGGRLVFCTCSLLHAEGEAQANAALARHPGLVADPAALSITGVDPRWIGSMGLRLRPDFWAESGGMDGFFIATFRRHG